VKIISIVPAVPGWHVLRYPYEPIPEHCRGNSSFEPALFPVIAWALCDPEKDDGERFVAGLRLPSFPRKIVIDDDEPGGGA
jgi:hypothetical protein